MSYTRKVLPISDIHGYAHVLDYITENDYDPDLITISGDIAEGREEFQWSTLNEFRKFQKKMNCPIVMIQGNHDYWNIDLFNEADDIYLLHNSGIEIQGLKIWGTPYTPTFFNWNHMKDDNSEALNMIYDQMPDNLDILLSHGPPKGYGDTVKGRPQHLGSESLYNAILKHKPKNVFCGHIHTGERFSIIPETNTKIYNVSVLDEDYMFNANTPVPNIIEV